MTPEIVNEWEKLKSEGDRSLAIMGAAVIDDQLKELLSAFCIDEPKVTKSLFSPTGALGAFGIRNKLAYVLGLIDKPTYTDIKQIQKIRNKFAHVANHLNFEDQQINDLTATLEIPQWVGEIEDEDPDSSRGRFFSGVRGVLWHLASESYRLSIEGRRTSPEPIFPLGDREGTPFH